MDQAKIRRPLTMTLVELGQVLGISRPVVYDAAKRGELPVPIIRIGKRMVVSRAAVDALLGVQGASEHTGAGSMTDVA